MQTKLTLRLEDQLIEQAKRHARRHGKSLSSMVADYFMQLGAVTDPTAGRLTTPPGRITARLRGSLRQTGAVEGPADLDIRAAQRDHRDARQR